MPVFRAVSDAEHVSPTITLGDMLRLWITLIALLAQPAVASHATEPGSDSDTTFEVYYHHAVRNRTDQTLTDVVVYLPLPVSDAYQQIEDFRVEHSVPVHLANRHDAFGTRIRRVAIPTMAPGEEVEVGFSCIVRLAAPIRVTLDPSLAEGADVEPMPPVVRDVYLRDHRIFSLEDASIKAAAAELLREHPNPVDRAHAIHDLIASTMRYKQGDGWDPAPEVLRRRSGSCSEFSYLFSALCRASGIPTRFVGASICPILVHDAPFQDRGQHRWVEVYLPGHGWVPFDPTLDRSRRPRQDFVGTHHGRTLIMTRIGDQSRQLGLSYIGANSHGRQVTRSRWFTWSQGTGEKLHAATELREAGRRTEANRALQRIIKDYPGTRSAQEAARIIAEEESPRTE